MNCELIKKASQIFLATVMACIITAMPCHAQNVPLTLEIIKAFEEDNFEELCEIFLNMDIDIFSSVSNIFFEIPDDAEFFDDKLSHHPTILCLCGHFGSINILDKLHMVNQDFSTKSDGGLSIVHFAAWNGKLEVLKWLQRNMNSFTVNNEEETSSIYSSAINSAVESFLKEKDSCGRSLIHYACSSDYMNILEWASQIFNGMEFDAMSVSGTPIYICCTRRSIRSFEFLVNMNRRYKYIDDPPIDLNQICFEISPLYMLLKRHSLDMIAIGVSGGMDVNARCSKVNIDWSPIFFMVREGRIKETKLLFDLGAKVNVRDRTGWTPLHEAAKSRNVEMCKLLISMKANPLAKTKLGITPFMACRGYDPKDETMETAKVIKEAVIDYATKIFVFNLIEQYK